MIDPVLDTRPRSQRLGRYELIAELARGGMAELYLARLLGIGGFSKAVAIKRILPHLSSDPRFVEMFMNEGRIAAHLSHPNVCQVYELGEVDEQLFLVMEYLEGVSWDDLATALPRRHGATLRVAAGVIGQICEGLHYAHELRDLDGRPTSVVHRDVSPQNMFVTIDGVCKVLDFGVSKMKTDDRLTRSGIVKGKLSYMPPEQIRGEDVDARADVFATGVVLWEALAGTRLFSRPTDYLIWKAITEEPIPPLAAYDPSYGAGIESVLARALSRDREQRYPTIRAFADEVRHVANQYGGPCTPSELADLVRSHCAAQLAERARQVALATLPPPRIPLDATLEEQPIAGETQSMMLRAESIAIARPPAPRTRWPAIAIGFTLAMVAGVAAIVVDRSGDDGVAAREVTGPDQHGAAGGASSGTLVRAPDDGASASDARHGDGASASDARHGDGASASDARHGDGTSASDARHGDRASASDRRDGSPARPKRPPRRVAEGARAPKLPAGGVLRSGAAPAGDALRSGAAPEGERRPPDAPEAPPPPGFFSIDSRPYATIFVDGKRVDQTPLYRWELPAGKHAVRAVLADGRARTLWIAIDSGKELSSGTLTW